VFERFTEPARQGVILAQPRMVAGTTALLVGWLLFAAALGVGIVIGWAIWG